MTLPRESQLPAAIWRKCAACSFTFTIWATAVQAKHQVRHCPSCGEERLTITPMVEVPA